MNSQFWVERLQKTKSSGSQGVAVSESSDKLIAVSRRQPRERRRRPRPVQKAVPKPVKNQQQATNKGESVAITRLNNNISPPTLPAEGRRPPSKVVMPAAVKPIPKGKMAQPGTMKFKTVRVQKQGKPKIDRRTSRKTRLKPMARTILYSLRLLIVGVGLGAIVGTLLSVLDPANRISSAPTSPSQTNGQSQTQSNSPVTTPSLYLSQEIIPLKTAVQNLATAEPNLTPGVFMVDLDTGAYVDINSNASFSAASTIKVPILIALFQDVDAGKIRLDEMLTLQQDMIAGGSGTLKSNRVGTQYSALEIATKMITVSDNTATNMLISRLGGKDVLNERFRTWGLATTMIRNSLPDLQGTNTTSPRELGNLISMINQGNIVSMRSRDLMLNIMSRTERDHLLPSGLGQGSKAYHKTGDIATMLADAGLIDIPSGKRYIAAVMVQRPTNDPRAEKLISSISAAAYQQFSQSAVSPRTPTTNLPTTNFQPPVQPVQPVQPFIQPPVMNPVVPNGMVNNVPMGTYQAPVMTPQYYPPQ
ncbi:serine hydrolase [Anabaena catenula]|uniref:serine hydrolase n=1 Tax=Anabaena catenula TaxID=1296320 RepID=UPI0018EFFA20|nr:serine hydrolase [Anabaena catenula]